MGELDVRHATLAKRQDEMYVQVHWIGREWREWQRYWTVVVVLGRQEADT